MSEPTTRDQLQDILQAVSDQVLTVDDATEAISTQKQAEIFSDAAGDGLNIKIQRLGPDQVPHAPRKLRLTGDAIASPQVARRADQTKEDYFKKLPHVTLDANQLVFLLTMCRLPLLKALQEHLGEPHIVDLPSTFSEGSVYHRVVSTWQNREDAQVLTGRSSNVEDGLLLSSLINHALDNMSEAEVSMYSDVSIQSQINEPEVASF